MLATNIESQQTDIQQENKKEQKDCTVQNNSQIDINIIPSVSYIIALQDKSYPFVKNSRKYSDSRRR